VGVGAVTVGRVEGDGAAASGEAGPSAAASGESPGTDSVGSVMNGSVSAPRGEVLAVSGSGAVADGAPAGVDADTVVWFVHVPPAQSVVLVLVATTGLWPLAPLVDLASAVAVVVVES
jgi:hypothetical protein